MAVPKRKKSRARTRHRRARWMSTPRPTIGRCAQCHAPIRPHTVCPECGWYKGRQAIDV